MSRKGFEARRGRLVAAAAGCAALAVVAAGCGSKQTVTGTAAQIQKPVADVKIDETEYKITPSTAHVDHDGLISVAATNAGKEYHALRIVVPGKSSPAAAPEAEINAEQIGEIDPGKTETLNIKLKPGTYIWYCPLSNHRRLGMQGKLVVG
jgi:uncharacterized cupredoxin-like copper-binding protein